MLYHNVRHNNIVFNFSVTLKSWMITFYGFRKGKFMVINHSPKYIEERMLNCTFKNY